MARKPRPTKAPVLRDSIKKIVVQYFSAVTLTPFEYDGQHYEPKELRVSQEIFFRHMNCLAKCGACCPRFSLDYLPIEVERMPDGPAKTILEVRQVLFDRKMIDI